MGELLKVEAICKSFPGVKALEDVSMSIDFGEVRGLVGENGAGKSTLIKIITGAYEKDSGRIFFMGREIKKIDPLSARKMGIFAVYQDIMIAPDLSVAENFFLGEYASRFGIVNWNRMRSETMRILNELGFSVDINKSIRELSLAEKEMVTIAKILSFNPRLVVFDEPTAVLTDYEKSILFKMIKDLKKMGVGIIYISHNLEEIFEICDSVTILRDGKVVGTYNLKDRKLTIDELISYMVGRKIEEMYVKTKSDLGPEVLRVEKLCGVKFKDVSFSLRAGEILGMYGLVGAGRTEIARAIFGLDPIFSGEIYVHGKKVRIRSPEDAIRIGIGYLPEDRRTQGLFLVQDVEFNINSVNYQDFLTKLVFIDYKKSRELATEMVKKFSIKTPSVLTPVAKLSGGNQQKILIARWMSRNVDILILDEPTNGIDVGVKAEIYKLMNEITKLGKGVIFISSYLPELMGICDRIVVVSNGAISGEVSREEFSEEKILALALKNYNKVRREEK